MSSNAPCVVDDGGITAKACSDLAQGRHGFAGPEFAPAVDAAVATAEAELGDGATLDALVRLALKRAAK